MPKRTSSETLRPDDDTTILVSTSDDGITIDINEGDSVLNLGDGDVGELIDVLHSMRARSAELARPAPSPSAVR